MNPHDKSFKDIHPEGVRAAADAHRPFHVSVQFQAEAVLRETSELNDLAFRLAAVQGEIMRRVQKLRDEARILARMAQLEAGRQKKDL